MYDSAYLTPEGLRVAEWVVGVLQHFLGDDFLERILGAGVEHQLLTNALGAALWPIVDGPSIYFDLFRLGTQVALAQTSYSPLRVNVRNVKNPSNWMHALIIKVKAAQAATANDQVWLYLQDHAGLWQLTPLAQMSVPDRFANLAPRLRQRIDPYPHVAGIVLTSGRMWAQSSMQDETYEWLGFAGAGVVRRLLPIAHARETVIVARSGAPSASWTPFRDWYENESTWLDWALALLGKPPMDALLHDPH
jgi:hypothetical protein